MTKDGVIQLVMKIADRVDDKDWHRALEMAEDLVGAIRVKLCLND